MKANEEHLDWPGLVRDAQAGDRKSLDVLIVQARSRILSYIHRLTLDYHLAEDLTHDVLLKVMESLSTLRCPERFWPWVFQIALNKVRDDSKKVGYRAAAARPLAVFDRVYVALDEGHKCPFEAAAEKELLAIVCQALETLDLPIRNIVVLRVHEKMSYAEIAEITGHSQARLRVRFYRAMSALRGEMKRSGFKKSAMVAALALFGRSTSHLQAESTRAAAVGGTFSGVLATSPAVLKLGLTATAVVAVVSLLLGVVHLPSNGARPVEGPGISNASRVVRDPSDDLRDRAFPIPTEASVDGNPSHPAPPVALAAGEDISSVVAASFTTLQAAIDAAENGDTITVPDGRYTGSGNFNIDFRGKTLILRSLSGPDCCIIDCQGRGRAFHFNAVQNAGSVIEGFTIINGRGHDGGAIYCEKSGPTIRNCIIERNEATRHGGAISGSAGAIRDCVIRLNKSKRKGGGLHACSDRIERCRITRNSAGNQGGGLSDCHGSIVDCEVTENICRMNMGGGLWNCDGLIDGCTVSSNVTGHKGGGFYGCDGTIRDCIVAWNQTGTSNTGGGGGFYGCHGTIVNCTIAHNWGLGKPAPDPGCTCAPDSHNIGGGVLAVGNSPRIVNCILWGNLPDQLSSTSACGPVSISYSNIEGGYPGMGNIDLDPLFVGIGEDYRLGADSPCIDGGDPNAAFADREADYDGLPRILGEHVDIGAYEYFDSTGLTAHAGPDQRLHEVEPVILDARMSCSLNFAKNLVFSWQQTAGPMVTLSDPTAAETTFVPLVPGQYHFALIVGDGHRLSEPDEVIIEVGRNALPVADAGADQHYNDVPQAIALDGTGSTDSDGDVLTYSWRQIEGGAVQITGATSRRPSFRPDSPGVHSFELIVDDGRDSSTADVVTVVVGSDALLYADAGMTHYVAGEAVQLDGRGSHKADGGLPNRYAWRQLSGPYPVTIDQPDSPMPMVAGFEPTDTLQVFEFELIVGHGPRDSHPDSVQVKVVPSFNQNKLRLENEAFDPGKPTIVYFGSAADGWMEEGPYWDCPRWQKRANILSCDSHVDTWPDMIAPRSFKRCGDMLIAYLSATAPVYDQPIQLIGAGAGAVAAADVACYLNQTYADSRYTVNRLTLIDLWGVAVFPLLETVEAYLAHPVADEACWVDNYILDLEVPDYHASVLPHVVNVAFEAEDMDFIVEWYKNSLTGGRVNWTTEGIMAGARLSVVSPIPGICPPPYPETPTYYFRWDGTSQTGRLSLYDRQAYPVTLLDSHADRIADY